MRAFFYLMFWGITALGYSHSAGALGRSDSSGGHRIGSYSIGTNLLGTKAAVVAAESNQKFDDPFGCAGTSSPSVYLLDTGDDQYRLMLAQVITAAAIGQRLTFILADACFDLGYGIRRPIVVGIHVFVEVLNEQSSSSVFRY